MFFLKKEAALTPVCLNAMPGSHRIDRGASGGFSTVEVAIKKCLVPWDLSRVISSTKVCISDMISPALSETQLPFGNDCYIAIEKWPIEIADLFQMMIFNSYVTVYQRVNPCLNGMPDSENVPTKTRRFNTCV